MKAPCDESFIRAGALAKPCDEKSRRWVLAATILGSSMAFIDSTVVNVALPVLQSDLHATVVDVQWVIESYGLFLSALILVGGALGDTFGRRAMFLVGVVGFALASAGCGFSASIRSLLVWRSVQGIMAAEQGKKESASQRANAVTRLLLDDSLRRGVISPVAQKFVPDWLWRTGNCLPG